MASYKFKQIVNHTKTKEHSAKKGGIAVLAYHGRTESGTKEIAEAIHGRSQASLYTLNAPPKARFASTKITHTHSKDLSEIKDYSDTAVSIHGHSRKGEGMEKTIYVTGGNDYLAKRVAAEFKGNKYLQGYKVETNPENTPKHLRGVSEYNIVNKFDKKGVQIELPAELRSSDAHKQAIVKSVATVVNKESSKYSIKENKEQGNYKTKEQYKRAA